jgi:monofunctional biosynthetic peptidoglycan transglycosylase
MAKPPPLASEGLDTPRPRRRRRRGRWIWLVLRPVLKASATLALIAVTLTVILRFANPPATLTMVFEYRRIGPVRYDWLDLEAMGPHLPRAAIAAEDANFCLHQGFDLEAIRAALAEEDRSRGASTISQQTAKNTFLWQGRSWLRKGLEAGFTPLIEAIWGKRRIMEVYLNVAEFGEGVFGVRAASLHYWGVEPDRLSQSQAAALIAVLPDPKDRSPTRLTNFMRGQVRRITGGIGTIRADGRADCLGQGGG